MTHGRHCVGRINFGHLQKVVQFNHILHGGKRLLEWSFCRRVLFARMIALPFWMSDRDSFYQHGVEHERAVGLNIEMPGHICRR